MAWERLENICGETKCLKEVKVELFNA